MTIQLSDKFLKKVWDRLRDSPTPIVNVDDYKNRKNIAVNLSKDLQQKLYLPSVIHGYLGIQKGNGVTRFLPILSAQDMGVYYHLCYSLAPRILIKKNKIYGAWHMIPSINKKNEEISEGFGQGYFSNPFSSTWWLTEWTEFNKLISAVIKDKTVGNFVATSDIANFYDSIEVPRLISKIRQAAPEDIETIEALNAFLCSWNRKHMGYMPSSKGIPQEIISDASRVLSHFYLQSFDDAFLEYCDTHGLTYIRWADDILVFGGSYKKLESAIHHASRLLRDLGLNLNASKTNFTTKSKLAEYRSLSFLNAISQKNHKLVQIELDKVKKLYYDGKDFRLDTCFRAMIGYLHAHHTMRTTQNLALIQEIGWNRRDLLHSLNATQMFRFILLTDKPKDSFERLLKDISKADFGGPKATFLQMLRKYRGLLASGAVGMTKKKAVNVVNVIEKHCENSEVIRDFCIPVTRSTFK